MPVLMLDNKLVTVDGKVATSLTCCCSPGSVCPCCIDKVRGVKIALTGIRSIAPDPEIEDPDFQVSTRCTNCEVLNQQYAIPAHALDGCQGAKSFYDEDFYIPESMPRPFDLACPEDPAFPSIDYSEWIWLDFSYSISCVEVEPGVYELKLTVYVGLINFDYPAEQEAVYEKVVTLTEPPPFNCSLLFTGSMTRIAGSGPSGDPEEGWWGDCAFELSGANIVEVF